MALAAIDAGADVIELGVPFSDPAGRRASDPAGLMSGPWPVAMRPDRMCWASPVQLRAARPNCGIVIFSYLNPRIRMGMKAFCAAAKRSRAPTARC